MDDRITVPEDTLSSVIAVSCGSSHSVALLDCNVVATWGRGEDGQLGHGDAEDCLEPKAVHKLVDCDINLVCCGAEYTIAVSQERREVYSWGWGDFGRLGHGNSADVFLPQQLKFFDGILVRSVACGDTHTLVVTEAGDLYSFGRNQNGQLGLGNTDDALSPQLVTALQGHPVVSIACGAEHTVAATRQGEVYCWGWGRYGNLGDGERSDRWSPTKVRGLDDVHVGQVACGWRHSVAVSSAEGRMYTFGWSKYGQLGHGDNSDRLTPTEVPALSDHSICLAAGGWRHTIATDDQGRVFAWGWNKFGQLGLGDADDRNTPTEVSGLEGEKVLQLSCGWRHTIAVTDAGGVYTWGRGVNGQLGHGDERDLRQPKALRKLCRGNVTRAKIIATATASGGLHVNPADRYAVVPGSDGGGGGGGGSQVSGSQGGVLVPSVSNEALQALKKQRTGMVVEDATVPGC